MLKSTFYVVVILFDENIVECNCYFFFQIFNKVDLFWVINVMISRFFSKFVSE